ncbi:hypothetical protein T310_8723, partial [Rasamsonia emersonii CBS 393.64]
KARRNCYFCEICVKARRTKKDQLHWLCIITRAIISTTKSVGMRDTRSAAFYYEAASPAEMKSHRRKSMEETTYRGRRIHYEKKKMHFSRR